MIIIGWIKEPKLKLRTTTGLGSGVGYVSKTGKWSGRTIPIAHIPYPDVNVMSGGYSLCSRYLTYFASHSYGSEARICELCLRRMKREIESNSKLATQYRALLSLPGQ